MSAARRGLSGDNSAMLASAIAGGPLSETDARGLSRIDAARFGALARRMLTELTSEDRLRRIRASRTGEPAEAVLPEPLFRGVHWRRFGVFLVRCFLGSVFSWFPVFFGTGFIEGVSACLVAAAGFKPVVRSGNRSQVGSIPIHSRQFGGNCVLR